MGVQQEVKKKVAQNSTFTGVNDISSPVKIAIRSPIEEPKRGDLTSRLQKEFGLLVDNDNNENDNVVNEDMGDTTPEEGSPPISGSGRAEGNNASGSSTRLLCSQIPSYTQNSYNTSLPPPVPPTFGGSGNRPPATSTKYPCPPPPPPSALSGLHGYQGSLNFPPPPPPVNTLSSSYKEDPLQPLPPPPPAPLPALKANGPSLTNSNRRPPSKDYYNRGSPGNGGRGYYTSNSHRDRSRDYIRDDRISDDRGHRRDDRDRDRDRGGRDHRDYRDNRSQSSRRQYQ